MLSQHSLSKEGWTLTVGTADHYWLSLSLILESPTTFNSNTEISSIGCKSLL